MSEPCVYQPTMYGWLNYSVSEPCVYQPAMYGWLNYSAPNRTAEYCDKRVCLCLCTMISSVEILRVRSSMFSACYLWLRVGPALVAYTSVIFIANSAGCAAFHCPNTASLHSVKSFCYCLEKACATRATEYQTAVRAY